MSLQIYGSNSLEHLAKRLAADLQLYGGSVFEQKYIVTQTQGMNNWLKLKVAAELGIVANCRFLKPNEMVNEVYFRLISGNKQALSAETLHWILFSILATPDFQNKFRKIADYYTQDDVKRMALAEKVADLFDQYQIYRPEMIIDWNENSLLFEGKSGWQKYLWVQAKALLGNEMPDKTVTGKHILETLQKAALQQKVKSQIPSIHVFGLSIITTYHLHILFELSRYIDVTFYLLNPAPNVYWFDDRSEKQLALWRQKSKLKFNDQPLLSNGNALLTGWGKVLQDTFSMFFETDEFLNQYYDLETDEPAPVNLLGKIQNDIFYNKPEAERNIIQPGDLSDGSITINSCHTPAREVEVLYNYLVHLVTTSPSQFSARDMVVMVSDIDLYAPYIKAVFTSAPYQFPFTIADESFSATDNLFTALQSILSLTEENFGAEEVLQLLDSEYIRKRFSLINKEWIRKVVNLANIRFGITGDAARRYRLCELENWSSQNFAGYLYDNR